MGTQLDRKRYRIEGIFCFRSLLLLAPVDDLPFKMKPPYSACGFYVKCAEYDPVGAMSLLSNV